MNKLRETILDQHARIVAAGTEGATVLEEMQGEIMTVATPELVVGIMDDCSSQIPKHETRSTNAQCRAFNDSHSVTMRLGHEARAGHGLVRLNFLRDRQGYVGGLLFDRDEIIVHGHAMTFRVPENDPIQDAMDDVVYPAMMWVKALRAEAYKNRPESAQLASVSEYLTGLKLSLGCAVTIDGDLAGATGFMPGDRMFSVMEDPIVRAHVTSEEVEVFQLSGLCDQAVVESHILFDTPTFATNIIELGGSLN